MELKHYVNNRGSADFQFHPVINSRCATYIDIPNVDIVPYHTVPRLKSMNLQPCIASLLVAL